MKLEFDDGELTGIATDALAIPVFSETEPDVVGALVAPLRDTGELKGKAGELTFCIPRLASRRDDCCS